MNFFERCDNKELFSREYEYQQKLHEFRGKILSKINPETCQLSASCIWIKFSVSELKDWTIEDLDNLFPGKWKISILGDTVILQTISY